MLINLKRKINEFGVFKIATSVHGKRTFVYIDKERIHSLCRILLDQLSDKQPSEKPLKEIKRSLARIDFDSK
jgi:hypothetical protein